MLNFIKKILFLFFLFTTAYAQVHYEPTHDSVSQHSLPTWYQDAKFGILIHYGISSVPGWAPLFDPTGKILTKEFFFNNPYPEWYQNTMQIKGSPTYYYHLKTWGADFKYDNFAPLFNQELHQWNPDNWSQLFAAAGAKYIVFVTKHHDGFLLWPSEYRNPYKPNFIAARDVVGELTDSVRRHHMRMGLYYSGGFDWSWPSPCDAPISDLNTALRKMPQSQAYADYVDNQWHELIRKYRPDLIWNDISLPSKVNKMKLFADYYNTIPEGVTNDRWNQGDCFPFTVLGQPPDKLIDFQLKKDWFDYYSPEYIPNYHLRKHKWEADHGPGYGFGYNREEYAHPEHFKNVDQLIADLADLVSKNGNLLLGIGPEANGTIPPLEQKLLLGMGEWLNKNGEAIYATKPWREAEGIAVPGNIPIRFTQSKNEKFLYLILLKNPMGKDIIIKQFTEPFSSIVVLNGQEPILVQSHRVDDNLIVDLSHDKHIPTEHPLVLKISY